MLSEGREDGMERMVVEGQARKRWRRENGCGREGRAGVRLWASKSPHDVLLMSLCTLNTKNKAEKETSLIPAWLIVDFLFLFMCIERDVE